MSEAKANNKGADTVADEDKEKGNKKVNPKEERKLARLAEEQARLKERTENAKKFAALFGKSEICQSATYNRKRFTPIAELWEGLAEQVVLTRARIHTSRKKGKMAFLVLRNEINTVQALIVTSSVAPSEGAVRKKADTEESGSVPKEMVDFAGALAPESIVEVEAVVKRAAAPITSTTKQSVELLVRTIHLVSGSVGVPFQLEDASRPEEAEGVKVNFDQRLNCRWLEMRTPASGALFRVQSLVGQYFRSFLIENEFFEIHSPKLIAAASEGGADVFKVGYFGGNAYLAQSPQLYKQMAVQGDIPRVFEVAPVFRAENSNTHRHLTEFVGLDLEMTINEHYFEIIDLAERLFLDIFSKLRTGERNLSLHAAIRAQYPFDPLVPQITVERIKELGVGVIDQDVESTDEFKARVKDLSEEHRVLRIPYSSAIDLLNRFLVTEEGATSGDFKPLAHTDDINTANEKKLGKLIKERYGVDFYFADRFPANLRPFYTMPCHDDPRFSNSFDIFIRGEEICSGAQRVHDPEMLLARAKALKVDLTPIKDYVDCFRLGAWPHGGLGVGLERVVMLYFGLHNIRHTSMFPRDPSRLTP